MKIKHRPNCFAQPWRDGKEESCNCSAGREAEDVPPPEQVIPPDDNRAWIDATEPEE